MCSIHVITAKVDGRPEAMMGLTPISAIDGIGAPWMLGTDAIYQHGRALLGMGPRILAAYRDSSPVLRHVVGAGNVRAIRLLRRWGFDIGEEEQVIGGLSFLTFSMGD